MDKSEAQAESGRTLALDSVRPSAIASNRQFRTWGKVAAVDSALVPAPGCKTVEDACRKALALWPNAKAAILFGSRARGDHLADSDWDIAFITRTKQSLPKSVIRVFDELREHSGFDVQAQGILQSRFLECADSFGNIAAPIAREGRLIAGYCEWPGIESEPILKPDDYHDWRSSALSRIVNASENLATTIDFARDHRIRSVLGDFVANSSDAAERFAKIAFARLTSGTGADIPRRHQVDKIANTLDRVLEQDAGPSAAWWRSDSGKNFRDLLCTMNGYGNEDHQSGYPGSQLDADMITRAADRLIATASFAILEAEELPAPGGLQKASRDVAGIYWTQMRAAARRLRQSLQDFGPNDLTFSVADPEFAESISVAVDSGEEIAQSLDKLADSLRKELEV